MKRTGLLTLVAFAVGCAEPLEPPDTGPLFAPVGGVAASVTGHWDRDVPAGPNEGRQQKVSFSAKLANDGTPGGSIKWMFHFPGSRPLISNVEDVTCMVVLGSTAWIGTVTTGPPGNPNIGTNRVWVVVDQPKDFQDLIIFGFRPASDCQELGFPRLLPLTVGEVQVHQPGTNSFTISQSFPININVFIPCALGGAGEVASLSGPLHVLFHFTEDESGGFGFTIHNQPQGISGVGLTSGDSYQGTGVTRETFHVSGIQFSDTFVNNFRIIGQGSGNNFLVHNNFHITINANGDLTAFMDNFSVECR